MFTDPLRLKPLLEEPIVLETSSAGRPEWPMLEGPMIASGTMRTLLQMIRVPHLCEAVFDNHAELRCSSYYRAAYEYLGRDAFIVPMSGLVHAHLDRYFQRSVFVRPDASHKPFEAEVVPTDQLDAFAHKYPGEARELAVVCEVIPIEAEYRCFVRNARVFAHSSYPKEPYEPAPEEVIEFAQTVASALSSYLSSNMLTIDVARSDGALKLMEVGGVNSWGLYGCALEDFVREMEAEALERYEEYHG